jgi:hypothetical protein
MVKTSEQINELSEALAKAQGKFGAAIKSSANPAFRSKYADLSSVIDATLEHLNAEGITVMQHPALTFEERGDQRLACHNDYPLATQVRAMDGIGFEHPCCAAGPL